MLKTHIVLLIGAVVISIVSFALYKGFGLSTAERIELNAHINANPQQLLQSAQLLGMTQPLEVYLEDTKRFEVPIPTIVQCKQILDASIPTLIDESNALSAKLATVIIPSFTTQLGALSAMLTALPLYTGRATELQRGNCSLVSLGPAGFAGGPSVTHTYSLDEITLQNGVFVYYIRVFSNGNYLYIANDTAAVIEFIDWDPPLGLSVNGTRQLLFDNQQFSLAVAPGGPNGVRFTIREYISSDVIRFSDPLHNLTAGSIVQVVSDLEMSIGVQ